LLDPQLKPSVVKINSKLLEIVFSRHKLQRYLVDRSVQEANFPAAAFELVLNAEC